jgi:hypothetical protein
MRGNLSRAGAEPRRFPPARRRAMASIMAIDLYVASGSPPSWRVWLSLEHKQLPYQLHVLSFQAGDRCRSPITDCILTWR